VTSFQSKSAPIRLEPCPACGVAVRVRKDGTLAIHSRGKPNVGMAEINLRCPGSQRRVP
jgi:hypothetical protein